MLHLQENSLSVKIISVPGSRIAHYDKFKPTGLKPFKGTNSIHQILYVKGSKYIQARKLSCITCYFEEKCVHYGLGQIELLGPVESKDSSKRSESPHHDVQPQTSKQKTSGCILSSTLLKLYDICIIRTNLNNINYQDCKNLPKCLKVSIHSLLFSMHL